MHTGTPLLREKPSSWIEKYNYNGRFSVYERPQKMFDGTERTFACMKRADVVNILPIIGDKIILTQELQPHRTEPRYALLGGFVDQGEDIFASATRELKEESGIEGTLDFWFSYEYNESSKWIDHFFIARNCLQSSLQDLENGEKIKLLYLSFDEFIDYIHKDNFRKQNLTYEITKKYLYPGKLGELKDLFFQ